MFDTKERNQEALQAFLGNVEWIGSTTSPGGSLHVVFRVNGELKGVCIRDHEVGTVYGHNFVHRGRPETLIEPLARNKVLEAASWLKVRFTEAEEGEYREYMRQEQEKWNQRERERQEQELRNKKRQLEQLKRELGEG